MFLTHPSVSLSVRSVSQYVSQSVHQSCFSCQRNSFETARQNFVKLCSYEGHNVQICIFTGNADLILLRSNLYPLFFQLPVTNAWNCHSLYTAMLEHGVCELAHSFFHCFQCRNFLSKREVQVISTHIRIYYAYIISFYIGIKITMYVFVFV